MRYLSVDDTAVDLLQRILNMNPEKVCWAFFTPVAIFYLLTRAHFVALYRRGFHGSLIFLERRGHFTVGKVWLFYWTVQWCVLILQRRYRSLPRFKIQGGHEYEAKIRHAEAKEKHRADQNAKFGGGGKWSAAGRGSIRLDPNRMLSGRGRGEGGGIMGARKFKITKGGAAKPGGEPGSNKPPPPPLPPAGPG